MDKATYEARLAELNEKLEQWSGHRATRMAIEWEIDALGREYRKATDPEAYRREVLWEIARDMGALLVEAAREGLGVDAVIESARYAAVNEEVLSVEKILMKPAVDFTPEDYAEFGALLDVACERYGTDRERAQVLMENPEPTAVEEA